MVTESATGTESEDTVPSTASLPESPSLRPDMPAATTTSSTHPAAIAGSHRLGSTLPASFGRGDRAAALRIGRVLAGRPLRARDGAAAVDACRRGVGRCPDGPEGRRVFT